MRFAEHLELLERLNELINRKGTGSPNELAKKLKTSRSSLYRYLDDLKLMGAEISFCKHRQSFYYENNASFKINFCKSQ